MSLINKIDMYLVERETSVTAKNLKQGMEIYKFGKVDNVSKQNHIIIAYSGKKKKIYDENESVTIINEMAKLSARGRKELARLEKEDTTDDGDVDWRRSTLSFMDDGRILKKYDVRFTATQYSKARKHSYGWKEYLKLKKEKDPYESFPNLIKSFEAKGWKLVSSSFK